MDAFSLTDKQAAAIVAMRLGQLTGLEQDKLRAEYEDIEKLIAHFERRSGPCRTENGDY